MSSLGSITLRYPGSYGLNTQEETLTDDETRFGATVTNGVVGSDGKLSSRKDFVLQTGSFSNTIQTLFTRKKRNGSEDIISAAAGKIYSGTSTLTQRLDYSSSSTTLNSWSIATLGANMMLCQAGLAPRLLDESYASVGFSNASFTSPNVCMSAFGRMWAADDTAGSNSYTIWWSNLLDSHNWGTGDAGSIDLTNAWKDGQDSIVNLAAFANKLVVFGQRQILLYTIPASHNPASMALAAEDVIVDLGLIARDSVQVTDEGVFFLSANGIYKIDRLGQTTSLMTRQHVSKLVNDDVLDSITTQTDKKLIRSTYYPTEGFYVLSFPTQNKSYCVHTRKPVPNVDGALVVTTWTNVGRPFSAFAVDSSGNWYSGGVNGVHKYSGYTPDGASNAYNFTWSPQWLPFKDESRLKHAKSITLGLKAASGQTGSCSWSVDYVTGDTRSESFTCDATEFAEDPGVGYVRIPLGGSFKVIQPTITFPINGDAVTLHQAQVYAAPGAIKP